MRKKIIAEIITETQSCLEHFCSGDGDYAISRLADNVVWIGGDGSEILFGSRNVAEEIRLSAAMNPYSRMSRQEFICVYHDSVCCVISGRFTATADRNGSELVQAKQSVTFLWNVREGTGRIAYIHAANPAGIANSRKVIPKAMESAGYHFLRKILSDKENKPTGIRRKNVSFRMSDGGTRFISTDEIIYAEAQNHDTRICLYGEKFIARMIWKDFLNVIGKGFIRVHRSYCINPRYVRALKPDQIEMITGDVIPVSKYKSREVYQELYRWNS